MPTLFRILVVLAVLGGLGYAGLWALATRVEPQEREPSPSRPKRSANDRRGL